MINAEMIRGPQDGRVVMVPDDCRELRFPVVLDPGFIAQFRASVLDLEAITMPVSVYRRYTPSQFFYEGDS